MFNILFVGGNFDTLGGRSSSIVRKFSEAINKMNDVSCNTYNGGNYNDLDNIISSCIKYDCVMWWANVPNDLPKIRNVKDINPRTMLITSKRNNGEYSFAELINRALSVKANLCVEFSKTSEKYKIRVFDPLGNVWYDDFDIDSCAKMLVNRVMFLKSITRQNTYYGINNIDIPDDDKFFNIIKEYAETFHSLIQPAEGVERFLGNSSFRCQRGFPSFKKNGIIFVSQRNVDKRYISKDAFVPTQFIDGEIYYFSKNKPSVDTPIQLNLYNLLPNINYMIHSHVYIEGAPFTKNMIPCGGLEEVDEIISYIKNNYTSLEENRYIVNLVGHGSIIMGNTTDDLTVNYIKRELPEYQCNKE